jgi:excinuclease UvrABC helicase subunit UvrB
LNENPKKINFVQMVKNSGFSNGIELYRAWFEGKNIKKHKEPYTCLEESKLIERQQIYGDNW